MILSAEVFNLGSMFMGRLRGPMKPLKVYFKVFIKFTGFFFMEVLMMLRGIIAHLSRARVYSCTELGYILGFVWCYPWDFGSFI